LEGSTQFKFVEKIFQLDFDREQAINQRKDTKNIDSFKKVVREKPVIENTFNTVKRLKELFHRISKTKKMNAAKRLKQLKRYVIYFEENLRDKLTQDASKRETFEQEGFFEVLDEDEIISIVDAHKKLLPDDFDSSIFESILNHCSTQKLQKDPELSAAPISTLVLASSSQKTSSESTFYSQMTQPNLQSAIEPSEIIISSQNGLQNDISHLWKQNSPQNWSLLSKLTTTSSPSFTCTLSHLLSQFHILINSFIASSSLSPSHLSQLSQPLKSFISSCYSRLIEPMESAEGEIREKLKLYLHVVYEVESFWKLVLKMVRERQGEIEDVFTKCVTRGW
jgi:hypothetical protein